MDMPLWKRTGLWDPCKLCPYELPGAIKIESADHKLFKKKRIPPGEQRFSSAAPSCFCANSWYDNLCSRINFHYQWLRMKNALLSEQRITRLYSHSLMQRNEKQRNILLTCTLKPHLHPSLKSQTILYLFHLSLVHQEDHV